MAKAAPIQYFGVGRRKTSTARVKLVPGSGKILINNRQWDEYVTVPSMRAQVLLPLETTESAKKFDVAVNVTGGGPAGQAGAIRHGIARALLKASPEFKGALRAKGLLTRDSRMKERKKYGQPGARKRFQFSKR